MSFSFALLYVCKFTKCFKSVKFGSDVLKKSHTCEEGGACLRISFWHLLMNLKNKLKQIIIKKTVEVGQ